MQIPALRVEVRGELRFVARPHRSKFITLLILDIIYSSQSIRWFLVTWTASQIPDASLIATMAIY